MSDMEMKTERIVVYGIVQGVGFRPFVSRIADEAGITGSVANKGSYVEIFASGSEEQLDIFRQLLKTKAPERSAVLKTDVFSIEPHSYDTFEIIESEHEAGDIFVSPDIATCPQCKKELYDPTNRRYMHPFINCTACGPRVTILDAMPYDRERTSMKEFPMCPECEYEYTHSETRRYDAQPVCCNDCGPEVYLLNSKTGETLCRSREAIIATRKAIMEGQIVAIKGIGGFHLCCDATNEAAVSRLRELKHRPMKPFAVMMKDLETVHKYCEASEAQEKLLDGPQKPIILLRKKDANSEIPEEPLASSTDNALALSVAPQNPKIGTMLPYAPVQMLLFDYNDGLTMTTDAFVMTSGNVSGAPICRSDEDALSEIASFCDIILSHDRKIRLRADDSVMDFYEDEPYMIRRSRGYAPLPFMQTAPHTGQVLAVGGELKNTFCLGKNQLLYPSPYVGDMADLRTVQALEASIERMSDLLEITPQVIACDMHPKYNTTVVAQELSEKTGTPLIEVQHHYAHILACMAENDYTDPVIGVSFDGTGYGTDGTIWGGEILKCDPKGFTREAHIVPFQQIGGDASAREGWRIALSMLVSLYGDEAESRAEALDLGTAQDTKLYRAMQKRKINCVTSTSAGRLFDAVSAILGVRKSSTFEGEASTALQFAAEEGVHEFEIPEALLQDGLRTDLLVQYMVEQYLSGVDRKQLAYRFHRILGEQIIRSTTAALRKNGLTTAALSGGVFQNTLLLDIVRKGLEAQGYKVLRHRLLPPNDGGIALGQALYAMNYLEN